MLKRRSKHFALLLVLTMLATMFVGVGTASAGTSYSAATAAPEFDPANAGSSTLDVATIHFKIDPAIAGDSTALVEVVDADGALLDINSATVSTVFGTATGFTCATVASGSSSTFKLELLGVSTTEFSGTLTLNVDAKDCAAGDLRLRFSSATGQFLNNELVVAKATGGNVSVSMVGSPALGDNGGTVTFRIKENAVGALKDKNNTIKFKLPNGFTFSNIGPAVVISGLYGAAPGTALLPADFTYNSTGERDLKVHLGSNRASTLEKIMVDIPATIDIDESTAATGDIIVSISGESSVTNSEVNVATYGNYSVEVAAKSEKTVLPGRFDQELGKIIVKESLAGSLASNRTITFTLPDGVKWNTLPSFSSSDSKNIGSFVCGTASLVGSDKKICKISVTTASTGTKSPELGFKGGSVTTAADFTGDIVVEIAGSAGANGEAKIGVATPAITVVADAVPNVVIGQAAQVAAALTITESKAEAIKKAYNDCTAYTSSPYAITIASGGSNGEIILQAPQGIRYADAPKVTVTEGDIDLGLVTYDNDNRTVSIKIDGTSGKASKISITDLRLIVDRTVPEGDIFLTVSGSALVENNKATATEWFSNKKAVAKVAVAKVVTPAPGVIAAEASFVIGAASYKLNGVEQAMDVAPYIKDSRTYMPIRYVAYALGINDSNILWDGANQTVTLMKGDKVVQLQVGSTALLINGASVTMDVAPEITSDRTMLPIRFVANAFGADAEWDAATQTVTIK